MSAHVYLPLRARIESIVDECGGPRPIRTYAASWTDVPRPDFDYRPGQCVQLSVVGAGEIFVSIASGPEDTAGSDRLELSVMRVGHVTSALHQLAVGDHVGLRGPYGNGFPVDEWRGRDLVLVGGGVGLPPIRSLLHHVLAHRDRYGRVQLFYGARSPEAMIYRDELSALEARDDVELYLSIDWPMGDDGPIVEAVAEGWRPVPRDGDGAADFDPSPGRFTGFVPEVVAAVAPAAEHAIAVTCGPPAMIGRVLEGLEGHGFAPGQVFTTLERRMKCGVGLCGRCNLGPLFVCTEGPVFSHEQLLGLPEAFA